MCRGGTRSGPLTIYGFDTELPGIRAERGDTVAGGAATGPDEPDSYWIRGTGRFDRARSCGGVTVSYGAAPECDPAG